MAFELDRMCLPTLIVVLHVLHRIAFHLNEVGSLWALGSRQGTIPINLIFGIREVREEIRKS